MCGWFSWGLRSREAVFQSSCFFGGSTSLVGSRKYDILSLVILMQRYMLELSNFNSPVKKPKIPVSLSPWKKCSLDACWSSFPVEILWLLNWTGILFPFFSFSGEDEVGPDWSACGFNKPVGLRGVTVSSRIFLSCTHNKDTCKTECVKFRILVFVYVCVLSDLLIMFPLFLFHLNLCLLPLLLQLLLFFLILLLQKDTTLISFSMHKKIIHTHARVSAYTETNI